MAVANPKVKITRFDLQDGTDRTMYATWTFKTAKGKDYEHVKEYKIIWYYFTTDRVWFVGNESTTTYKQATYNFPNNATAIKIWIKPISTTYEKNKKQVNYWIAVPQTQQKTVSSINHVPEKPETPAASIRNNTTIQFSINTQDANTTHAEFQVLRNGFEEHGTTNPLATSHNQVSGSLAILPGRTYKVRCRGVYWPGEKYRTWYTTDKKTKKKVKHQERIAIYGPWSDYSETLSTPPSEMGSWNPHTKKYENGIEKIEVLTSTSVRVYWIHWKQSKYQQLADSYTIEYTNDKHFFDSSEEVQSITVDFVDGVKHAEITGLDTGQRWYFRARANNDAGSTPWTGVKDILLGTTPSAPTTWSETSTVILGETARFYWIHNSEDESEQTAAQLYYQPGGGTSTTITFDDGTKSYDLDTSIFQTGKKLNWKVRTKGILPNYGPWSTEKEITIYARPSLSLAPLDTDDDGIIHNLPVTFNLLAGPNSQTALSYHLAIYAVENHDSLTPEGRTVHVSAGACIWEKFFDAPDTGANSFTYDLTAKDCTFVQGQRYKFAARVTMDSGLYAESNNYEYMIDWDDAIYDMGASIGYDEELFSVNLEPYCYVDDDVRADCLLYVYRREVDGSFTLVDGDIECNENKYPTTVVDPHPALDYARYRIVAISNLTGQIEYIDLPGYPIGESSLIIQWDEEWQSYDVYADEDEFAEPIWQGSLLKLPYNIDISNSYANDVSLIKYIGRKYPVSYYGTYEETTSTWSTTIPIDDDDTLFTLRRLATYNGDCYVRDPYGNGYWANVKVSFSLNHLETTAPVSISVTRVEGGV